MERRGNGLYYQAKVFEGVKILPIEQSVFPQHLAERLAVSHDRMGLTHPVIVTPSSDKKDYAWLDYAFEFGQLSHVYCLPTSLPAEAALDEKSIDFLFAWARVAEEIDFAAVHDRRIAETGLEGDAFDALHEVVHLVNQSALIHVLMLLSETNLEAGATHLLRMMHSVEKSTIAMTANSSKLMLEMGLLEFGASVHKVWKDVLGERLDELQSFFENAYDGYSSLTVYRLNQLFSKKATIESPRRFSNRKAIENFVLMARVVAQLIGVKNGLRLRGAKDGGYAWDWVARINPHIVA